MKAVYCPRYGAPSVLEQRDVETPTFGADEILIRTRATTVTTGDCRVRALRLPAGFGLIGRLILGISKPRQPILGSELSGVVEGIGSSVKKFKVGDEVVVFTGTKLGCHAEIKVVAEDDAGVVSKPAGISFHEAAAIASSGTTAAAFLRRGKVGNGDRILVVGASGGVGSAAVMLAKYLGAYVTAVCGSRNVEFVTNLGADRVIDYNSEDFKQVGEKFDAILDTTGTLSLSDVQGLLVQGGRLLLVSGSLPILLHSALTAKRTKHKLVSGPAPWTSEDLQLLTRLAQSGEYRVPIDRIYSFARIAEAHTYVDGGRKRGNVVLSMQEKLS